MEDKYILDWLQEHMTSFRESGDKVFTMEWIDKYGHPRVITAINLRECVMAAIYVSL